MSHGAQSIYGVATKSTKIHEKLFAAFRVFCGRRSGFVRKLPNVVWLTGRIRRMQALLLPAFASESKDRLAFSSAIATVVAMRSPPAFTSACRLLRGDSTQGGHLLICSLSCRTECTSRAKELRRKLNVLK